MREILRTLIFATVWSATCIFAPSRYTGPPFMFMTTICSLMSPICLSGGDGGEQRTGIAYYLAFALFLSPLVFNLVIYDLVTTYVNLPILPFTPPTGYKSWEEVVREAQATGKLPPAKTKTLKHRPLVSAVWVAAVLAAVAYLALATPNTLSSSGDDAFRRAGFTQYAGIAVPIAFSFFTVPSVYYGAELNRPALVTLPFSTVLICLAYRIGGETAHVRVKNPLGLEFYGLPIEILITALFSSIDVLLLRSLYDHTSTLLILDPTLPVVPPNNHADHVGLLSNLRMKPREIDMRMLASIVYLDQTLRDEARTSHLHSPRNFRIPYLVINSWYLCVMRLVRESDGDNADIYETRRRTIAAIKLFLVQAYDEQTPALERVFTLCTIPHATPKDHAVFYLFATLIPRLVPIYPFLELCEGLAVDAAFMPDTNVAVAVRIAEKDFDLDVHLPIHTLEQLKDYATAVYGSFVAAYMYLAWSTLQRYEPSPKKPVEGLAWAEHAHGKLPSAALFGLDARDAARAEDIGRARAFGHAFGLITIAANVDSDAREHRLYLPLSKFYSTNELLSVLSGLPPPAHLVLPLLDTSDQLRGENGPAVYAALPKAARRDLREMFTKGAATAKEVRKRYA